MKKQAVFSMTALGIFLAAIGLYAAEINSNNKFVTSTIASGFLQQKAGDADANGLPIANDGSRASASTIALGASGPTQTATITLKDDKGNVITGVHQVHVYIADDSAGATPSSATVFGAVTATTGAIQLAEVAKLDFECVTSAGGVLALQFNNTGGGGTYTKRVVLVVPTTGGVIVSAALAVLTA